MPHYTHDIDCNCGSTVAGVCAYETNQQPSADTINLPVAEMFDVTKPQGDTGMPSKDILALWSQNPTPVHTPTGEPHYTSDELEIIRMWMPIIFNKPSEYLKQHVRTVDQLLEHARAHAAKALHVERNEETKKFKEQNGTAWLAWQADCQLRKQWVEGFRQTYLGRKREAQRLVAEYKGQLDQWVEEARAAHLAAQATPVPQRPQ